MSAQFVSLAVGYALGHGTLRRKGVRKRPWLELRRLETESTYLDHQVRALRRAVRQTIRVDVDLVPGKGYYDICRARIQSPLLERAIEVAEGGLNEEALQVAGLRGLACLWLDRGRWWGQTGEIGFPSEAEAVVFRTKLAELKIPCSAPQTKRFLVRIAPEPMHELAAHLRPYVHRSMRHALRPGAVHGAQLLP